MKIGTVKTETFAMDYCTFGTGARTLVILPGVSLKPVVPSASAVAMGFSLFEKTHTVYLFDRIQDMPDGYSVRDMAQDTAQAMTQLGISNADIFGASQGGMIAQWIAIDHPQLAGQLYLGSTTSHVNACIRENMTRWLDLAKEGNYEEPLREMNQKIYSEAYYQRYAMIFHSMEAAADAQDMRRLGIQLAACLSFDVYDRLKEITCPVFVVGAGKDEMVTGTASEELAARLGCPLYMYPDASHAVYDEAPDYRSRMLKALTGGEL